MAKKRFTDDLFGLFEEPTPQRNQAGTGAYADQEEESVEVDVTTPSSRAKRKLTSKKFTKDLDSFLSDNFEREGAAAATSPAPASAPQNVPHPRRRKTGLDLLIRSTVADEDRSTTEGNTAETKRVTLIFKKDHLSELKEQAKERGLFLKDVVQEMVEKYLEEGE